MDTITINGKDRPIHFGLKAIQDYAEMCGRDFEDILTTMQTGVKIKDLIALAAIGLNNGARRSGSDTRYTTTEVWDMVDDDPTFLSQVGEKFATAIMPDADKLGSLAKKPKRPAVYRANRNG